MPADFTPWLAQPENIAILGEAIGMDLEVEAQEKAVGRYSADVLCKETITGRFVVIENQLESTDHSHLGQLLTYAAGLDAAAAIWVARQFTDEHRAALDHLNTITETDFNFFGHEIELWRIGESLPAPKFNVVSQPNDWARTVHQSAAAPGELSDFQRAHLDYWTQFGNYLRSIDSPIRPAKPSTDHWKSFAVGRTYFGLVAANGMRDGWSAVGLPISGPDKVAHFHLLRERFADALAGKLGDVERREMPGKKEGQITLVRECDPTDRESWEELQAWMAEKLETWTEFFRPIVKSLDASEYQAPDEDQGMFEESED